MLNLPTITFLTLHFSAGGATNIRTVLSDSDSSSLLIAAGGGGGGGIADDLDGGFGGTVGGSAVGSVLYSGAGASLLQGGAGAVAGAPSGSKGSGGAGVNGGAGGGGGFFGGGGGHSGGGGGGDQFVLSDILFYSLTLSPCSSGSSYSYSNAASFDNNFNSNDGYITINYSTNNFTYSPTVQTFKVPDNVYSIDVEVVGGAGGNGFDATYSPGNVAGIGGKGSKITASISVVPRQVLYFVVGGKGGSAASTIGSFSGYNGGGSTGLSVTGRSAGGGGGTC